MSASRRLIPIGSRRRETSRRPSLPLCVPLQAADFSARLFAGWFHRPLVFLQRNTAASVTQQPRRAMTGRAVPIHPRRDGGVTSHSLSVRSEGVEALQHQASLTENN